MVMTISLPAASAARLALIQSVPRAMEVALALHEYGAHAFLQELVSASHVASPPLISPAGESPWEKRLVRWHSLAPSVREALAPLVERELIVLSDGTSLPFSEQASRAVQGYLLFHGAIARGPQGSPEILVDQPPVAVLAGLLCEADLYGFAPGQQAEAARVVALVNEEADRDARSCFHRGFPATILIPEEPLYERGRALAARDNALPAPFADLWVELYSVQFAAHYAALVGSGGDEADLLDDAALRHFEAEQLRTYEHNVVAAMIAADYLGWREGADPRYYRQPDRHSFQERGQFGFMDVIGGEGLAVLLPGQTYEALPLAHRCIIWRGLALLEQYELAQGKLLPSPEYERRVPPSPSAVVRLERAHRYFARLYPDARRAWTVYPAWAGPHYDDPGDSHTDGHDILPTWLRQK